MSSPENKNGKGNKNSLGYHHSNDARERIAAANRLRRGETRRCRKETERR